MSSCTAPALQTSILYKPIIFVCVLRGEGLLDVGEGTSEREAIDTD
jgi:hypothetical protein